MILSVINREISGSGYLNQLGIFHQNTYNPYNLGCDFLEPLRPLVDFMVYDGNFTEFNKTEKHILLHLFQEEVKISGKKQVLLYAIRLYCKSLFRALQSGDLSEIEWIEYEW